jgi:hypothetical protein
VLPNLQALFYTTKGERMDCLKANPWPVYLHFSLTFGFAYAIGKYNALGVIETIGALFKGQKYERNWVINALQAAHLIPFFCIVWIVTSC